MDTNTTPICGHAYTKGQSSFTCVIPPHPAKPNNHHFQAGADAQRTIDRRRRSALVVVPGERRDG